MHKLFLVIALLFTFAGTAFAVVNINTAAQSELEMLQGIGPAKAKAIIEYREKNGLFKSASDLDKVSGIGSRTVKQLHQSITAGDNLAVKQEKEVVAQQEKKSNKK